MIVDLYSALCWAPLLCCVSRCVVERNRKDSMNDGSQRWWGSRFQTIGAITTVDSGSCTACRHAESTSVMVNWAVVTTMFPCLFVWLLTGGRPANRHDRDDDNDDDVKRSLSTTNSLKVYAYKSSLFECHTVGGASVRRWLKARRIKLLTYLLMNACQTFRTP